MSQFWRNKGVDVYKCLSMLCKFNEFCPFKKYENSKSFQIPFGHVRLTILSSIETSKSRLSEGFIIYLDGFGEEDFKNLRFHY